MMHWKWAVGVIAIGTGLILGGCGVGEGAAEGGTAVASATAEDAELVTARFSVDGMTCGGCAVATEMAVKRVEGVRSVTASLGENGAAGNATVQYDAKLADTEGIAAAIRKAGFTPSLEGDLPTSPEG